MDYATKRHAEYLQCAELRWESSQPQINIMGPRNCPPESVSSPPARCPALPSGGTSVVSRLISSTCLVNSLFHSSNTPVAPVCHSTPGPGRQRREGSS